MKFNPKTGLPYMDPATGEPYIEYEFSDTLLTLLKRHFPEYKEKTSEINVSQTANNGVVLTTEKLGELQARRAQLLEEN